ncbi:MAG: hypothetical protein ACJAYB_000818, partial [Psychromonas sp.]
SAERTLRASLIDEIQRQGKEVAANAYNRASHIVIRRVHFMHRSTGNHCAEHTLQASLIDTPTPMKKAAANAYNRASHIVIRRVHFMH